MSRITESRDREAGLLAKGILFLILALIANVGMWVTSPSDASTEVHMMFCAAFVASIIGSFAVGSEYKKLVRNRVSANPEE